VGDFQVAIRDASLSIACMICDHCKIKRTVVDDTVEADT